MASVWYSTVRDVIPSPPCNISSRVKALDVPGGSRYIFFAVCVIILSRRLRSSGVYGITLNAYVIAGLIQVFRTRSFCVRDASDFVRLCAFVLVSFSVCWSWCFQFRSIVNHIPNSLKGVAGGWIAIGDPCMVISPICLCMVSGQVGL